MANDIKGLCVTFKAPIRKERAEKIMAAIEMLSDVVKVELSEDERSDQINRANIRMELAGKLWEALK